MASCGGVAERLKAHAWKACIGFIALSRVRIPLPPPSSLYIAMLRAADQKTEIAIFYIFKILDGIWSKSGMGLTQYINIVQLCVIKSALTAKNLMGHTKLFQSFFVEIRKGFWHGHPRRVMPMVGSFHRCCTIGRHVCDVRQKVALPRGTMWWI